ncbi:hypothetical protein NOCARDAX2BIS_210109 [Nocardioides sp. AX2bis]|nr:hypothetical protein NOCARDAX2BIS_210109 [Nocardioides sp. AX2bis]
MRVVGGGAVARGGRVVRAGRRGRPARPGARRRGVRGADADPGVRAVHRRGRARRPRRAGRAERPRAGRPGPHRDRARLRHLLAAVPQGPGHPGAADPRAAAAAAGGGVRDHRPDQRARLHPEPVPGRPGGVRPLLGAAARVVRRDQLSRRRGARGGR